MSNNYLKFIPNGITFSERPISALATQRLAWKATIIIWLIGNISRNKSSSLRKLSLFLWIVQNPENEQLINEILRDQNRLVLASVKFDPTLPRTLSYLKELKLLEIKNSRYRLTQPGVQILLAVNAEAELFKFEKQLLASLEGSFLTDTYIDSLYRGG